MELLCRYSSDFFLPTSSGKRIHMHIYIHILLVISAIDATSVNIVKNTHDTHYNAGVTAIICCWETASQLLGQELGSMKKILGRELGSFRHLRFIFVLFFRLVHFHTKTESYFQLQDDLCVVFD